jgi:hypothetical protein
MLALVGVPVPSLQIGRLTRNLRAPLVMAHRNFRVSDVGSARFFSRIKILRRDATGGISECGR